MGAQEMYQALADPTRREILRLLRDGDLAAGEIAGHFEISWPAVSRHLGILANANLVHATRHGSNLVYTLTTSVRQACMVMRRIRAVIASPTIGSASLTPRATAAAETITPSETKPSTRAWWPSATRAGLSSRAPARSRTLAASSLPAKPMTPAAA